MAPGPNSDEEDGCSCKVSRFHYGLDVPAAKFDDIDQLQSRAVGYSVAIFRRWIELNTILKRFEAVIQKRWAKKNFAQRTSILLQAWPGMSATHRPDFAGLRDGCRKHRKRADKEKVRQAHLWPYVNIEDLVQPCTLPVFLHSRGRNLPGKFAFADQLSAHARQPPRNDALDGYRMFLHGRCTPRAYGAVEMHVAGSQEHAGREMPTSKLGFHPCAGVQVLEIQSRLLDFLTKCCHLVLHDTNLLNIACLPHSACGAVAIPAKSGWPTIMALAAEAPYRLPQRIDLARIRAIVAARRDEAEDHVWALREDPGYFAAEIKDWSEHASQQIKNKHGLPHDCVGTREFWNNIGFSTIVHAYSALILWDDAQFYLDELIRLDAKHHQSIHPGKRLPWEYEQVFKVFDRLIREMKHWPLSDLATGFCASPPLRASFVRGDVCDPTMHELNLSRVQQCVGARRLCDLFKTLLSVKQHGIHGLSNISEEIQRTMDHESDKALVSSWVAARFADLATIVEIERQLNLFQPWAMAWRSDEPEEEDLDADDESRQLAPEIEEVTAVKNLLGFSALDFSGADPAHFSYPVDKRRSEATVVQMRKSERALDDFWVNVDVHVALLTSRPLNSLIVHHLVEPERSFQRTPRWTAPSGSAQVKEQTHGMRETADVQIVPSGLALTELDPNSRHARPAKATVFDKTPSRVKAKTRHDSPLERPKTTPVVPVARPPATAKEVPSFVLNRRAYKVFATLFHMPDDHHTPGEIAWSDFLYAMSALGFSAEKLYGSAWQFTPQPLADGTCAQRPIQFHEPHPHSKLHVWLAKRNGRRLSKAYGWHGGMFASK